MDEQADPQSYQVSTRWFVLSLAIVLAGVSLGYFLLVKPQERQRPANKPTALGHTASESSPSTNSNAAPSTAPPH